MIPVRRAGLTTIHGYLLLALQLAGVAHLLLTGNIIARNPACLALEAGGVLLGAWALCHNRPGNFNMTTSVRHSGGLVTSGPYRFIRHPMYAAQLVSFLALVLDVFTPARLAVWGALGVVLVLKLSREEEFLLRRFVEYAQYARHTRRLIPWVY